MNILLFEVLNEALADQFPDLVLRQGPMNSISVFKGLIEFLMIYEYPIGTIMMVPYDHAFGDTRRISINDPDLLPKITQTIKLIVYRQC